MELFRLFGSVMIDDKKAIASLKGLDDKSKNSLQTFNKVAGAGRKIGLAVVAGAGIAAAAMYKMATKASDTADNIDKMSQKLGMSRVGYQEWSFVLSQAGVEIDSMQTGIKTLTTRISEAMTNTGKGAELFKQLGIQITDSMSQEDVFNATVQSLQNMEAGVTKAAIATELFGKSGQNLIPLLNDTAQNTDELKKQAQELGLVLSDTAVDGGVKFQDTMDAIKRSTGMVSTELGVVLMPYMQKLADWILANMPAIKENIKKVMDGIAEGIEWIIAHKEVVFAILGGLAALIVTLTTVQIALNLAMLANPVVAIISGIVAAIGLLVAAVVWVYKNFDMLKAKAWELQGAIVGFWGNIGSWFKEKFQQAVDGIKSVFSSIGSFFGGVWKTITGIFTKIGSAIGNAIGDAFKFVVNSILGFAEKKINGFLGAINMAIGLINKIPGVNIKKLGMLSIPKMEEGGVLRKGKVGFLEGNGDEAVVPLERNTEWIDKLSVKLNERSGDSQSSKYVAEIYRILISGIDINLNGREFGRTVKKYV